MRTCRLSIQYVSTKAVTECNGHHSDTARDLPKMSKDSETQHRLGPQRNPAIDDAVLDATRQLLEAKGYAGTSIDAIATRAGVGRPALSRRRPSKATIVNDAIQPVLDVEQHGRAHV